MVDVKIISTRKQYLKWSLRQTFKREKPFRNGVVAIENGKYRINLKKPIYIGASLLELYRELMQKFY